MITLASNLHKLLGKHTVRLSAMPHLQQAKKLQRSSSKTTLKRVRNVLFTTSHVRGTRQSMPPPSICSTVEPCLRITSLQLTFFQRRVRLEPWKLQRDSVQKFTNTFDHKRQTNQNIFLRAATAHVRKSFQNFICRLYHHFR